MKMHSRAVILVVLQVTAVIFTACMTAPSPTPLIVFPTNTPEAENDLPSRNPFDTVPCSPPCWHNISPGQTTIDETKAILFDEMRLQDECTIDEGADSSLIECSGFGIWFDESGYVTFLDLLPDETITIRELVSELGAPEEVLFCNSDDYSYSIKILSYRVDKLLFYTDGPYYQIPYVHPDMVMRKMLYGVTDQRQRGWSYECGTMTTWHGWGDYQHFTK